MPDVSILIVNWNASALLFRCLERVHSTIQNLDFEVILVDNGSADESVAMARDRFPQVRIIENQHNVGFAAANNQALRIAGGRYALLLNTDAFLHPGAVATMVKFMEAYPDTGAAGCRLLFEDGEMQRSCSSFPTLATELWQSLWLDKLFPTHRAFGKYLMTYWNLDDVREVDCVSGACMMLNRQAIQEIGPLDEDFFLYSEEVDLCYRLMQAGWKVRFIPDAAATHVWGGSASSILPEKRTVQLYESRVRFFRKHYGNGITLVYKLVILLRASLRVFLGFVGNLLLKDHEIESNARRNWVLLRSLPVL